MTSQDIYENIANKNLTVYELSQFPCCHLFLEPLNQKHNSCKISAGYFPMLNSYF
ncbi:MAG: hypothetical protein K0S32_4438 [Bacteroidetes bacterium]|jgi:hypothetical protein|nr:hypothetical protein [Bacteroidota bacterium]